MTNDVRRTRLSSDARRRQLLQIGVDMLDEKRLEDLSIDDIAAKAEISRGLLFHYFASMQDFQVAVATEVMDGLVDRLGAPPRCGAPESRRLERSVEIYVDYIAERPDLYRSVVRGASSSHERMRGVAAHTRERIVDIILDDLKARDERGLAADDVGVRLGAHAWIAMTEEMVARWLDDQVIDRAELVARVIAPLPGLLGMTG